jgi:predicted transcriptional regulator
VKQNVTISLDKDLIRKAKVLAAQRDTSLSRMLSDELASAVEKAERYDQARRKALADLAAGFHLGGKIRATREEWHAR